MKKYCIAGVLHLTLLFSYATSTAQPDPLKGGHDWQSKKRLTQDGMYLNTINIKARRNFKKQYENINNEKWIKSATGESTARFEMNGCITKVVYDKYGHWEATVKGYMEDLMPFNIRDRVKRSYYDFAIDYVDEVLTTSSKGEIPTYIVHISYKNKIKFIRVGDDDMEVWKEFDLPQADTN